MAKTNYGKKDPQLGMSFLSPFYFTYAVTYSDISDEAFSINLSPRIHAAILFSYFALESFVCELMGLRKLLPDDFKQLRKVLTKKIKGLPISSDLASREPYASVEVLENLRHVLVHLFPIYHFVNWIEGGVQKRSAIESEVNQELKKALSGLQERGCIPPKSEIAVPQLRTLTPETAKWACDTVFLMFHQLDTAVKSTVSKSMFSLFKMGNHKVIQNYQVRSRFFQERSDLVKSICNP
jgi:hypothetical protein